MDEKYRRNCSKFINQRIFESFNSSVKKTPEQHFTEIAHTIGSSKQYETNVYLEDWSNGMRNSPDMFEYLDFSNQTTRQKNLTTRYFGVLIPSETLNLFRKS
jgi:D-citramalate synthase